jgi:hypothetical protein
VPPNSEWTLTIPTTKEALLTTNTEGIARQDAQRAAAATIDNGNIFKAGTAIFRVIGSVSFGAGNSSIEEGPMTVRMKCIRTGRMPRLAYNITHWRDILGETAQQQNQQIKDNAEQIKSLSENGLKSFENAKKEINDTTDQKVKTSYNNSEFNKLAARGFTKKRIPSYLREALIGSLSGAAGGAFLGGIGAIPGAIVGGLGSLGYEALTDLWYESISSTGKAYLQAKDALMKSYKMYDALKDIDINTANQITDKVNGLMKSIESLNLNNKEKSGLENLIQQLEQSAQSGISEVKERVTDKVTENAMPILQGIANEIPKTVYERLI